MFRRINLFGGPSSGKSTTAAGIFHFLRLQGKQIELIQEYVKNWAYRNHKIEHWDQFYFMAKQIHKEQAPLLGGVDLVVSDSPTLLSIAYAKFNKLPYDKQLLEIEEIYEKQFPSINIYLARDKEQYNEVGRWQDLEEAVSIDMDIQKLLIQKDVDYVTFRKYDIEQILDYINGKLGQKVN